MAYTDPPSNKTDWLICGWHRARRRRLIKTGGRGTVMGGDTVSPLLRFEAVTLELQRAAIFVDRAQSGPSNAVWAASADLDANVNPTAGQAGQPLEDLICNQVERAVGELSVQRCRTVVACHSHWRSRVARRGDATFWSRRLAAATRYWGGWAGRSGSNALQLPSATSGRTTTLCASGKTSQTLRFTSPVQRPSSSSPVALANGGVQPIQGRPESPQAAASGRADGAGRRTRSDSSISA